MKIYLSILFIFLQIMVYCQVDTLNQIDENGLKQGYWIYFGKDRPDSHYSNDAKVEEGKYVDGKKTGTWLKYHIDGQTIKLRGEYINNRPVGIFIRTNSDNTIHDSINITNLRRGGSYSGYQIQDYSDSTQNISTSLKNRSCNCINDKFVKIYDKDGNILFEGRCKNDDFWDGKMHYYDNDGILLRIEIWKEGKFHSLERL